MNSARRDLSRSPSVLHVYTLMPSSLRFKLQSLGIDVHAKLSNTARITFIVRLINAIITKRTHKKTLIEMTRVFENSLSINLCSFLHLLKSDLFTSNDSDHTKFVEYADDDICWIDLVPADTTEVCT